MTRMEFKSKVGPDGVLTLRVTVGKDDANKEVVVTVQSAEALAAPPLTRDEWIKRIGETAGSIQDPTFRRHDQGEYERRQELP